MKKKHLLILVPIVILISALLIFTRSSQSDPNRAFDQVKEYIQKRYPKSQKKRAALLQFAQDFEDAMKAIQQSSGVEEAVIKLSKSGICIDAIFPSDGGMEANSLYAEIMSSFERSSLGLRVDSLLYEYDLKWPPKPERIKECRFDISKMEN